MKHVTLDKTSFNIDDYPGYILGPFIEHVTGKFIMLFDVSREEYDILHYSADKWLHSENIIKSVQNILFNKLYKEKINSCLNDNEDTLL